MLQSDWSEWGRCGNESHLFLPLSFLLSLANLDQDLPNNMVHTVPIKSLPQEWLWCETWCDDESKARAKTIDLVSDTARFSHTRFSPLYLLVNSLSLSFFVSLCLPVSLSLPLN